MPGFKATTGQTTPPATDSALAFLLHVTRSSAAPPAPPLSTRDWRGVVRLGAAHGVLGLVSAFVDRAPEGVPDDLLPVLRASSMEDGARYLLFARQLRTALAALEQAGLSGLALKGPVLASMIEPAAPERRPCVDLDLLVRPGDVLAARAALHRLGYEERHAFPRGHERRCLQVGKELVFDRPGHASIDLHWRLTRPFGALGNLEGPLWERAITVNLEGAEVSTLCAEDHLLFLCVHGCGHGWSRLRWVADIASLLASHPDLDTAVLIQTARQTGSLRLLLAGLGVARRVLHASMSEELTIMLQGDPFARAAAHWYAERLFAPDAPWARRTLVALLRQGGRNRLREAVGAFMTPTEDEWSTVQVPAAMFDLYRGIRVARILGFPFERWLRDAVPGKS